MNIGSLLGDLNPEEEAVWAVVLAAIHRLVAQVPE